MIAGITNIPPGALAVLAVCIAGIAVLVFGAAERDHPACKPPERKHDVDDDDNGAGGGWRRA